MRSRILCQRLRTGSALLIGSLLASFTLAQSQNPFQGLQNALNKAAQSLKTPTQTPNQASQSQSQAGQPQSSSNPPSAPTQLASGGAAAPWTPPTDTPTAPAGPLDPAKLPDVGGIHIGAPSTEVPAILKTLHPGVPVQTLAGAPAPLLFGVSQSYGTVQPNSADIFNVYYTYEPGKPQVVHYLSRRVQYLQPIARANLIAGLRQKYGPETLADKPVAGSPTTNDADIGEMYWLFDEQGHVVHPGNPGNLNAPYGCISTDGNSGYRNMIRDFELGVAPGGTPLPPPGFCDSLIELHVVFEGYLTSVQMTETYFEDRALTRRSSMAIANLQKSQAQKQRQNEQNQANQAKPNL
jgi:hypothetical protein